ncbi:hypothetical protein HanXRQr2_Chr01g0007671 [Helianthus annuus]|uniref:Uncharacterized protein n=1 Tax=Helianthus annuus TaxID=4232 RepID=A0A9K3JSI3_HELAN|nr:hypothetical protein HanXRQr2_Chr01g0007671 [Helianthus annuus]KAJ0610663.1 hypothetical protein HanHA300_Chr01g0006251 [Helianthus annuus]KAJ0621431.1 hypothetical protein HanIR_Chr01g0008521 [Helianthus annuus]KAJ0625910.1 hypothetical protein HanHA89_Chr01g0006921 [Helianthus annuus]KAJ0782265.1 hypothetical protein HanLR1_Chr01g0006101 [Helianthus annuus]
MKQHTTHQSSQGHINFLFTKPYMLYITEKEHLMCHQTLLCVLTCLILNRPFNILQAIFNYMVDNIHGEKFLQYPRFIQMILDDKNKNLPKVDADELILDHMDVETLKRLNVYQGVETDKEPPYRKQFAAILKPDYVAPHFGQWRHDDSNSDSETKKMEPFF